MLISPAYAQGAGEGAGSDPFISLLPLVLIFVVFWFLLIRPQQKKAKAHKAMVQALRRGDKVVTAGGLVGTVTKILNDVEAQVEIADGVRVKVIRQTLQDVVNKSAPAPSGGGGKKSEPDNDDAGEKKGKGGFFGGKSKD